MRNRIQDICFRLSLTCSIGKQTFFTNKLFFPDANKKCIKTFLELLYSFNYGPPTKIKKLKNAINCKPNKIMIIVCLSKQKYLKCLKLITHPNQWNVFETSRIASTRQGHQKMNQEKEIKCLIWRIRCRLKSKTINYQKIIPLLFPTSSTFECDWISFIKSL